MLCKICIEQIQPRKIVLDYADYAVSTLKHEVNHADRLNHADRVISTLKDVDHQVRIDVSNIIL